MLQFGLYTRKSDDDRSVTEKSITEQLTECSAIINRDALIVIRQWEESRSARYPGVRAGYSEMITMVERGRINAILCWHINRLVRNMEEGGKLVQLFIEGKIREIRTPHGTYRTGDNILPLVIEAASATQYSLDHAKDVERGMHGAFLAGGWICAAPQGYRNIRNPLDLKKGLVEIDPNRFDVVHHAWDLMLTGIYTVRQVVDTMNNEWGFRTRPTREGGNRPLSYSGAYRLFMNPFFAGFVRVKGQMVKGRHEAMVTFDEFESVQAILRERSFSAPRTVLHRFTGLMHCIHCGQQITAETKLISTGRLWENYRCSDSKSSCTKSGMSRDKVFASIAATLDSVLDNDLIEIAIENIRRVLNLNEDAESPITATQDAAIRQSKSRLERLDEMWLDGILTDRERYNRIEATELAKQAELSANAEKLRAERTRARANLSRVTVFLSEAKNEFYSDKPERIKTACRALATDYQFDGKQKTIYPCIHPLLNELSRYARQLGSIELGKGGSCKQKQPTLRTSVAIGGPKDCGIELPSELVAALKGPLFPEIRSSPPGI